MTQEEIKLKSEEKVKAIKTLCNRLQVVLTAEDVINQQMIIKKAVYFNDTEKYDVDEESAIDGTIADKEPVVGGDLAPETPVEVEKDKKEEPYVEA